MESRTEYVTSLRGKAEAMGLALPRCDAARFHLVVEEEVTDSEFRRIAAPMLACLAAFDQSLEQAENTLIEAAKGNDLVKLCATVPGVGLVIAATFVSVLDDPRRFRSGSAVAAYLGLVPAESSSGGRDKQRLGHITKQGNSYARTLLIQSAWTILRAADEKNPLYLWIKPIVERRSAPIAVVALARKLACVLYAICRDGTPWNPECEVRALERGAERRVYQEQRKASALAAAGKKISRRSSSSRSVRTTRAKPATPQRVGESVAPCEGSPRAATARRRVQKAASLPPGCP